MSDSIKQKVTKWKVIYVSCSISINEIKVLQKFKNLINRWFYSQFDLTFLKIIALLLIMFSIIVPKLAMWKLNVVLWQINFVVVSQWDRRSFRLVEIRLKVSKQNIMDNWAELLQRRNNFLFEKLWCFFIHIFWKSRYYLWT